MENLLKLLPSIINDENGLAGIVDNPDSLTLQLMETDISQDIVAYSQKLGRDNHEIQALLANVKYDGKVEDLVSALKASGTTKWAQVADFIEKLQTVDGINLEGKSIPSVLWASTMFGFISEKERAHAGTARFVDPLEVLTIQYLKGLATSETAPKISINKLRAETVSIFKNSSYDSKIKEYVAKAILKNADWKEEVNLNDWYDLVSLRKIPVENDGEPITSVQELLALLETPTVANYQKALDFVKENYLQNEGNSTVKTMQSNLVVGLIGASLIDAGKIQSTESTQLKNISFNIYLKLLASQSVMEDTLKNYNHLMTLSRGYTDTLQEPIRNASMIALEILGQNCVADIDLEEPMLAGIEESEEEEEITFLPSYVKVGDKKAYINGYLALFSTLVEAQIEDYKITLDRLSKVKSQKGEQIVTDIAHDFDVEGILKTEDDIASKNQRTVANAQITYDAVKNQLKTLNLIMPIYNRVKNKTKENLDLSELEFDKQLLRKDFHITEAQHEEIIREFYAFVASDPILKQNQAQYRLFPSKSMKLSDIKERAMEDSDKYPNVAGMLRLVSSSAKTEAERTVYKLYADSEGNIDEKYEALYEAITRKGASLRDKKLALDEAVIAGDLTPKQQEIINQYIIELENKAIKKAPHVEGQMEIDFGENDAEIESENE